MSNPRYKLIMSEELTEEWYKHFRDVYKLIYDIKLDKPLSRNSYNYDLSLHTMDTLHKMINKLNDNDKFNDKLKGYIGD